MKRSTAAVSTAVAACGVLMALSPSAYASTAPGLRGTGSSAAVEAASGTAFSAWKPVAFPAFTAPACNTTIRFAAAINHEVERHRRDSSGNTIQEVRGQFVIEFTRVGSKEHYFFDISGESVGTYHSVAYANGDYLLGGTGNNFFGLHGAAEQASTGFIKPVKGKYYDSAIIVSSGPLRVLFTENAKGVPQADLITRPKTLVDVCAVMGLGLTP